MLLEVLQMFGEDLGLFTNLDKCLATPIRTSGVHRNTSSSICGIAVFLCCYLGIPLVVHKLRKGEECTLVEAITARIPSRKGRMVNHAGCATVMAVTLSAIPMQTSICLCL